VLPLPGPQLGLLQPPRPDCKVFGTPACLWHAPDRGIPFQAGAATA